MKRTLFLLTFGLGILSYLCADCNAIRSAGNYCGIPIFDRWDGCTLYSGIYVMYISEKVKDELRKYAGQAVQIEAEDVYQPVNPGDGIIRKLKYLGPAPETRNWIKTEGIVLSSSIKINEAGKPIATITIQNKGKETVKLFSRELALTLLTKKNKAQQTSIDFSDGPSYALITRQSFEVGSSEPRWEGTGYAAGGPYSWTIGKENALPHDFTLDAGQEKKIDIQFDLPDGEYDFLCGYSGGVHEDKCLASNLSAFDVKDGKAKIIEIKERPNIAEPNLPADL